MTHADLLSLRRGLLAPPTRCASYTIDQLQHLILSYHFRTTVGSAVVEYGYIILTFSISFRFVELPDCAIIPYPLFAFCNGDLVARNKTRLHGDEWPPHRSVSVIRVKLTRRELLGCPRDIRLVASRSRIAAPTLSHSKAMTCRVRSYLNCPRTPCMWDMKMNAMIWVQSAGYWTRTSLTPGTEHRHVRYANTALCGLKRMALGHVVFMNSGH